MDETTTLAHFTLDLTWSHACTEAGPHLRVASASIRREKLHQRYEFLDGNRLDRVLAPTLADIVEDMALAALLAPASTRAHPDVVVSLPGLVMADASTETAPAKGESRNVTVHFDHFIGDPQAAFAPQALADRPTLERRETLGIRALEDVALPLLSLAQTLAGGVGEMSNAQVTAKVADRLTAIAREASQLNYQTMLLQRYVESCDPRVQDKYGRMADPVERVSGMAEPPLPAFRPRPA